VNAPSAISPNAPGVFVIHKGGRVHTWCADLVAGFDEIGCRTHTLTLRSRSWQERREQWAGGGRLWENQATLQRCAAAISRFKPQMILLLNFAGLPDAANLALRKAAGPGVPLMAWREILAYRDLDDLAQMTRELFHQPESATRIIAAGRARVVAGHTHARRASRFVSDWLPGS